METSARPGGGRSGKEFVGEGFILLMEVVPVPGGGSFATASERSEHRWVWVGGERSSLGGDKDHERSEYRTGDLLLWEQGGCEDKTMSEKIFERTSTCLTRRGS